MSEIEVEPLVTREHSYRLVFTVTKENRKALQAEYGKRLWVGDTLTLSATETMQPIPSVVDPLRKLAAELGGKLEYRLTETVITSTEWAEPDTL